MSSREEFEYEAGKALSLPVSIIEQARKGDRYDHDFDSMSLMQPLNGWWHWWQAGRAGLESRLKSAENNDIDARCHVAALEAKCAALAAENAALKAFGGKLGDMHNDLNGEGTGIQGRAEVAIQQVALEAAIEEFDAIKTPATDAFLAEVRAQAHKEGAHFVANRMLAAWEAGFIEDTAKNAADIARMILTSTEFMPNAPEGDFDRSFADVVLEDIAAQLRREAAQ